MDRLSVYARHVCVTDAPCDSPMHPTAVSAAAPHVKVFPPGGKHFVTNPWQKLRRYDGDGSPSPATTIPAKFAERVKHCGHLHVLAQKRGARDGPWTKWTWNEYFNATQKVAKALLSLGCEQFQAINILGWNSPEWFFAVMGGIFAGLTPAGIYITNGPDGVEYILNHSKSRVIFLDSDPQLQKVLSMKEKCPNLHTIVHWGADCPVEGSVKSLMSWDTFISLASSVSDVALDARVAKMHPDNACYLSYTSGTTGNPKAVMYSHDNILWAMQKLLQIQDDAAGGRNLEEREISYLPLSHIAGNAQLLGALALPPNVNSLVHFAFPDAMQGSLPDTIREVRPTIFLGVPRVWEKLFLGLQELQNSKPELKSNPKALKSMLGLESVRVAVTGAAPIAREIMEFFDSVGLPIFEIYGMTENTAYSHFNQRNKRRIGSVGPALTDEGAGSKIAAGTGEICTWSRGVMMGYMYMPEKSADAFDEEGFLRTGDVGEVKDGFTFITGRIKEMIITAGGENMAPVLLENEIKERLPALSNVVMIGDKQKYLIAMMTLKLEPDGKGGFTDKLAGDALTVDPACKTYAQAQQSEIWKKYLADGVAAANRVAISRAQHTRKYVVIPGDFSPVGDLPELTPTMKLRREVFLKKYLDQIKQTYGSDFMSF